MLGLQVGLVVGASIAPTGPGSRQTHVFLIAGQSNSTDRAAWDGGIGWPANVYQVARADAPLTSNTDQVIVPAVRPLDHWTQPIDGGFGWSLQFIIDYVGENPDVDVVLVPAGKGGTSFAAGEWTRGTGALYLDAVARVNALMSANPGYRIKGVLWHQGESDGDTTGEVAAYQASLDAALSGFRDDIAAMSSITPIILGEIPPGSITPERAAINAIIGDAPNRLPYVAVASASGMSIYDSYHFDPASMRTMGSRYYAKLAEARTNAPAAPGQVTGLSASPGDGQAMLAWSVPATNRSDITDYQIEISEDAGDTWAIVGRAASNLNSYTHTGLTNGDEYLYRVSAVNAVGIGAASAPASVTPEGAASWAPTDMSELRLGVDSSDLSGLYTDNGVTNVTAAGQAVYRQNDMSPGAHNLTQAVVAARPLYGMSGVRHFLDSDGSDDFISVLSRLGLGANPALTVSIGMIIDVQTTTQHKVWEIGDDGANSLGGAYGSQGWSWRFNGGALFFGASTGHVGVPVVATWTHTAGGTFASSKFYLNGVEQGLVSSSNPTLIPANTGARTSLFGSGNGSTLSNMKIIGALFAETEDATNRANMDAWNASKLGITI